MIKFDHMGLPVADPPSSRDWYVSNFGFAVEFEVAETGVIAIQDDAGFTIFLEPATAELSGTRAGLTLQVDDVDAKHAALAAGGVEFTQPPAHHFWGYGAELLDPDGYRLYLWDEVSMRTR